MYILKGCIVLILIASVAACSSGGNNDPPFGSGSVVSITINPSAARLNLLDRSQLTATPVDAAGRPVTTATIAWTSDDTTVATVSSSGLVEALGVGSTPVRARVGSVEASIIVLVETSTSPVAATVEIDPVQVVIGEGLSTQFGAIARDADGNIVTGRAEQWISGDATIALVEPLGRVTGLRAGVTTVTVKVDGVSATGSIRVESNHAFSLLFSVTGPQGASELFSLDISDSAAVEMPVFVPARPASDPTPSPDGSALAFVVVSGSDTHIYRADRNGSNPVQLTKGIGLRDQPAWSPDGTKIAYRERMTGLGTDIWTMNASDGSDAVNLTSDLGATSQSSPAWSQIAIGGAYRIAYSHSEGGLGHIWTMRSDGGDKVQLTASTTAYDDQPAWSPDGSRIVFQRSSGSIFGDLYWVDATVGGAGSSLMPLIGPLAGPQFAPAWSPDGNLVAFTSRHTSDEYQIFTVWADGSRLAQRTFSGEHSDPTWIVD